MSYKTNAKALRLGISHDWRYKGHGLQPRLHLDRKLAQYAANLVEYVVPQAPQRAKTKGRFVRKFSASPGVQGRTLVLRGEQELHLFFRFYLNLNGAGEHNKRRFERNLTLLSRQLSREARLAVRVHCFNFFMLFWRMRLFTGRRIHRRLRAKVRMVMGRHTFLRRERVAYSGLVGRVRRVRRALRRFRRQRYFSRSFYPILGAFLVEDFDADLAAKAIALELQILRIYHKRFMRYVRRLLWMCFHHFRRPPSPLEGLRMEVRGRMTDHRRQVRRAQTKTTRFGTLKKSSLRVEAGHCRYLAYNRYGVISVSLTYQQRTLEAERWEDRGAQTPLRAFLLLDPLENWADWRDSPLPPTLSLRHPTYEQDPTALLDNHRRLEHLWRGSEAGTLSPAEAAELAAQPPLEILNRVYYYRHRFHMRGLPLRRPQRHRLLLRPKRYSIAQGFSNRLYYPPRRGVLAPFQLQLQRLQQLRLRMCQGYDRRRRSAVGPTVPPTLYQRWVTRRYPPRIRTDQPVPGHFHLPRSRARHQRHRHPWRRLRRRAPLLSTTS